jgi:hypothetical protein
VAFELKTALVFGGGEGIFLGTGFVVVIRVHIFEDGSALVATFVGITDTVELVAHQGEIELEIECVQYENKYVLSG